jgi:D-alanyl-D-alanine carboxypeptidase (penicillin-binding protein 5/6)
MGSKDRKVRDAQAIALMSKGFAMVPPRPETPVVQPAAIKAPTVVSGPTATVPQTEPPDPVTELQQPAKEKSSWGIFFIGLGTGCLLFLGFIVVAGLVKKRRSSTTIRSKYRTRD